MRYIDSIVTAPEERILHRARLHWTIFFRPSSILTLFLLPLVRWLTCEAVVTSRRIVIASGWLTRYTFELPLSPAFLRAAAPKSFDERLEDLPLIDKETEIETLDEFEIPTFLRRRVE